MIYLYFFEDHQNSFFYPFQLYRPVFLIRHGIYNLYEYFYLKAKTKNQKILLYPLNSQKKFDSQTSLSLPTNLSSVNEFGKEDLIILINGNIIPNQKNWTVLEKIIQESYLGTIEDGRSIQLLSMRGEVANQNWAKLNNENEEISEVHKTIKKLAQKSSKIEELIDTSVDSYYCSHELIKGLTACLENHLDDRLECLNQDLRLEEIVPQVYSASDVNADKIEFDTSTGKIIIEKNTKIGAYSVLSGPLWIGRGTIIKPHTILSGSSIGNQVRLSGEINHSIINDYSNKAHHGFLGDTLMGSWVNLGAGTTTSNLKNNYTSIRLNYQDDLVDSGMIFLGALLGDFSKTAINTSIYPGVSLGFGGIGSGIIDKNIDSFCTTIATKDNKTKRLKIDLFLAAVEKMFMRREIDFKSTSNLIRETYSNLL